MNESKKDFKISFEIFPPKTEDALRTLNDTCIKLNTFKPEYFSVTFGAGGSTQQKTEEIAQQLVTHNISTTPHISCVNMDKDRLIKMVNKYIALGINHLVVIQGDDTAENANNDFHFSYELVQYIREITGNHFHISVAAYPEYHPKSKNTTSDLENFKRKVDAGANSAITQFFYNSDAYFHFIEHCLKLNINVPIIPGILPIHDYSTLIRLSAACGAEIPLWLRKRLESYIDDPESIKEIGIETVTKLCEKLLAQGICNMHFYTLNKFEPTACIIENLELRLHLDDQQVS